MASASDHRAHAALQPADCLILLPQRLPAAVETSIGPAHYPAECTQSDAFLQPSLRARKGRANSNSLSHGEHATPKPDCSAWPISRAARTLGGDIGSSVRRRWIALSIALAIAAIGGTMLTSPTPLAP